MMIACFKDESRPRSHDHHHGTVVSVEDDVCLSRVWLVTEEGFEGLCSL